MLGPRTHAAAHHAPYAEQQQFPHNDHDNDDEREPKRAHQAPASEQAADAKLYGSSA